MLAILVAASAYHGTAIRRGPAACVRMGVSPVVVPDHCDYLNDVALTVPPPALPSVVGVLVARGETLVAPGADATLHPLLVPLTRDDAGDGEITGLLRWPGAGGGGSKMPVVRTSGRQLELLADCAEHFVARAAVMADVEGATDAADLLEIAAQAAGLEYSAGAAAASPGGAPGFLITKVGPFVSAYKQLATRHVEGGSEEAALITCERTQACFQAWGHPYAFHARLLDRYGRDEEARADGGATLQCPQVPARSAHAHARVTRRACCRRATWRGTPSACRCGRSATTWTRCAAWRRRPRPSSPTRSARRPPASSPRPSCARRSVHANTPPPIYHPLPLPALTPLGRAARAERRRVALAAADRQGPPPPPPHARGPRPLRAFSARRVRHRPPCGIARVCALLQDRASYLLDLVVAAPEEYSWEGVRPELAGLYREADQASIATFVAGAA